MSSGIAVPLPAVIAFVSSTMQLAGYIFGIALIVLALFILVTHGIVFFYHNSRLSELLFA